MSVLGEVPEKLGGRRRANQEGLSTPLTILGSTGFSPLASDLHFSAGARGRSVSVGRRHFISAGLAITCWAEVDR